MLKLPHPLNSLFENNRHWVAAMQNQDPDYFKKLANQQAPEYLWIGCSDSRVPANQITGLAPGQVFVHRNIANVIVHTDLNALSVIQFAVDVLRVKHIMVVGHYGCSGVHSALTGTRVGLADNWLQHVQDVRKKHAQRLEQYPVSQQHDRLCELNVLEQVLNVCHTTIVQDAWERQQPLNIHGWVYGLQDGLIHELGLSVDQPSILIEQYQLALNNILKQS
jgi:carbonic anhydrase